MSKSSPGVRYAEVDLERSGVRVHLVVDLDGGTRCDVDTGVPFLDHMLSQVSAHGGLDLGVSVETESGADPEHVSRAVASCLGKGIRRAVGDVDGLARFGEAVQPMDEALVVVALDFSGRGYLGWDLALVRESIGGLPLQAIRPFFETLAMTSATTLHVRKLAGEVDHHLVEAAFKGFGRCLRSATCALERKKPRGDRR